VTLNPHGEAEYRHRLALDHLNRAENLFSLKDWAGTVSASQLAVENFAKAVIALFEVPTWGHDPSHQLSKLAEKMPAGVGGRVKELCLLASETASEHGRSSYGEPIAGLTPSDIYTEKQAEDALQKARRAREIAARVLGELAAGERATDGGDSDA